MNSEERTELEGRTGRVFCMTQHTSDHITAERLREAGFRRISSTSYMRGTFGNGVFVEIKRDGLHEVQFLQTKFVSDMSDLRQLLAALTNTKH